MSSASSIFVGAWINHSHNAWLGATITLKLREAGYLSALLVLVVTVSGQAFWIITSYVVHQTRSREVPHDALYYQQQAILKNSETALSTAWKFAVVSFSWREHERSKWWQFWKSRTIFHIVLALIVAAVFGAASVFSSEVTKAVGSEVLIQSSDCGFWEFDSTHSTEWQRKLLNESIAAAAYARNCYETSDTSSSQCNSYKTSQIPWTSNENASCPFAEGNCKLGPTAAYQMDTGLLDSHDIFGLNAKSSDRVSLRKVATCAPIHALPYAELVNLTVNAGGKVDLYDVISMGPVFGVSNYTYAYNTHSVLVDIGYDLTAQYALAGVDSGWTPIPEFNRTDADVSVFFLVPNSVLYAYNNSDPFFSANIEANTTYTPLGSSSVTAFTGYWADSYVYVFGCTDQYQICNPTEPGPGGELPRCTPLGPAVALAAETLKIGLNDYQQVTSDSLIISLADSSMYQAVGWRGSSALKTQETIARSYGGSYQVSKLPNNRWHSELSGWFATSLVAIQQALMEKARGPTDVATNGGTIVSPLSSDHLGQALCKQQMIRNVNGYQNFSTLGVAIILVLGTILVILGWTVDIVVGSIQKRLKKDYARLSWISDGYLQLQRMAFEGAGFTDWSGCADEVPVTDDLDQSSQRLSPLNIKDLNHPRIAFSTTAPMSAVGREFDERIGFEGTPQERRPMLS